MNDIDEVRNKIRGKKNIKPKKNNFGLINKFLVVVLITIITLILLKSNSNFKEKFYKYVYQDNISFAYLNNLYKKYFGSPIPTLSDKTKATFDEKIAYDSKEKYQDGVKLKVSKNYSVPALNTGMVIFIGEKEGYGNTIIIEGTDGVETWYGNVKSDLKMYDYIEKGSIIGEADELLYLVFKKDGNILNYEDYL